MRVYGAKLDIPGAERKSNPVKISVVIPCLNEARTVGQLVQHLRTYAAFDGRGETVAGDLQIIVVDNGSEDVSALVAEEAGAEVLHCPERGYGAALRFGVSHARHDLIAIMDADLTYKAADLRQMSSAFHREQADLLLGDRLRGEVEEGAMPALHRYLGTPFLSFVLRSLFRGLGDLRDCNSGYRVFRKSDFLNWDIQSSGMEIASEMIAKAALQNAKLVSVPIGFHKSPVVRRPHLRPWRDGFRHLRTIVDIRFQSLKANSAVYQK